MLFTDLSALSILSFPHRQSFYQAAKVDCQAIKAIFVCQLLHTPTLPFYFLPSHLLLSSHYIFVSLSLCVCVCQWERGRFVLYCWADMVNKPCLSVCLFSNNESVSQSATQSVNLRVSELFPQLLMVFPQSPSHSPCRHTHTHTQSSLPLCNLNDCQVSGESSTLPR